MSNGLIYTGRGDFVIGIPARDLTPDEVEQYGGAEALLKTGLYKMSDEKPAKKVS